MEKRLVMLVILDGYGINERTEGNAVAAAHKPNLDRYMKEYPNTIIHTSGLDVGLPRGQMGNSEVGHTNIGAGRIVYQELTRITKSIEDGDFFEKKELVDAMENCRKNGTKLHLYGLVSDGGVHSHNTHLYALVEMAKRYGLKDVFVHCFFDGRDVPPDSAKDYVAELEAKLEEIGVGKIASVMGRYYAMDRDNRWERTERAYRAMVYGEGERAARAVAAVEESYKKGETDEFVQPSVIVDDCGQPRATIKDGDAIIFYNFRPDRARQLTRAFVDKEFTCFSRGSGHPRVHFTCMTQYDETIPVPVAFPPLELKKTLGEVVAAQGLKQLRIAETEKYAHVTFFFNGGEETCFEGETRRLIPSPKVATYDLKPEMSAREVTEAVLEELERGYDLVVLNYANPDMVGHTGCMEAAVKAVETVDQCVGRVVEKVKGMGGTLLITADHGNAEQMQDPVTGGPHTAHTTNPVPLILISPAGRGVSLQEGGRLADVAPTILDLLGIEQPPEMTGTSLLLREGIK